MRNQKRLIVLLLLLLSFSCVSFAKPTEITYLIPENYRGGVIVFFDQPDGITPEKTKDDGYIYRIPPDGLLKIKTPFEKKAYKLKYYLVDAKDNRTELEYIYPKNRVKKSGDTTRNQNDVTEDEQLNRIFVESHETGNFNSRESRVYLFQLCRRKAE